MGERAWALRVRDVAVVVLAMVAGAALWSGVREARRETGPEPRRLAVRTGKTSGPTDRAGTAGTPPMVENGPPAPEVDPPRGLPSPRQAVEAFLAAEEKGDFESSYRLLAAADRDAARSAAGWVAAHADLPPIAGFRIQDEPGQLEQRGEGPVEVATSLELRAGLDEVVGLVPSRARARWATVKEEGSWRVAYDRSSLTPEYPSEDRAGAAVQAWAQENRSCSRTQRPGQYSGGLLGPGAEELARSLCRQRGEVEVGPPRRLDDGDAAPFLAAFGPEATEWARVVPLSAAAGPRLGVVVAPVGTGEHGWLVIGLLEERS